MKTLARGPAALIAAVACSVLTAPVSAQNPSVPTHSAVTPDTVTVGDAFTSVVRVMVPPGSVVRFSGVELRDSVQPVDTVRVIGSAADSGATASYRLVAWVAAPIRASARVRVTLPDGTSSEHDVTLAMPTVRSVLPAGDLPPPRPGRGVAPLPARPIWPWIATFLSALILAALFLGSRRRPRASGTAAHPRAAALTDLQTLVQESDPRATHERAARILRRYLAATDPAWGEEWTTTELLLVLRAHVAMDPAGVSELSALLDRADRVKFAGRVPDPEEAHAFLRSVGEWIASYPHADGTVVRHGEAA